MAKKYKTMTDAYDQLAEKLTKKHFKNSKYKLIFVEGVTEHGEPCLYPQIVRRD